MKRCTLDTNIITAFLKNDSRVVERVSDYLEFFDKLTINIISYYEILRGLKDLGNEEKLRMFDNFIQENELVFITKDTIEKAAEIYAYLKKEGNLIEDADILMASTAIVEDLVLITNNIKHFKRVKGLRTDNWLQN
ncbi:MAG: type II toxin-antitoxin system VapC family toxin [Proteobacteria bacterium]|nr:type II toxin-antitoxin system VapC family toxin [Pseudomonadota bacterium]MBU4287425.1 type II toxin-antitoxin system VapC family toxin [Pseudomonadota bacterium]MBU4414869.1 type II toxin-antitoxin system VapC family toxin [Pseudomonadota bacterium]MCG2757944.1 type II toxin-antitoxin system VapC family toxin [Desulfobacteraceae bacterium]